MVKSMVLGAEGGQEEENQPALTNDCLIAQYHTALPNMVLLAYSRLGKVPKNLFTDLNHFVCFQIIFFQK